jgi:hypothetical protein
VKKALAGAAGLGAPERKLAWDRLPEEAQIPAEARRRIAELQRRPCYVYKSIVSVPAAPVVGRGSARTDAGTLGESR